MIRLEKISKSFSGKEVLSGVDLHIPEGDFCVIVGKSGCGKSTLLKIIGSFEKADSGYVIVNGLKPSRPSMERIMVFQDFSQLFPWKSVLANVITPLRKKNPNLSKKELRDRALQALSLVGLEGCDALHPHQLSGGMKQRAAIARAIVSNPEILLMDEPFASLDAITREKLQSLTLSIWEKYGTTIVFVTHDISEAAMLSTRIAVLDGSGGIVCMENNLGAPDRTSGSAKFMEFKKKIAGLL